MEKTKEQLELENEIYKKALRRIQNIDDDPTVKSRCYTEDGALNYPRTLGVIDAIAMIALKEGEAVMI